MKTISNPQNIACVLAGLLFFAVDSQAETNQVSACLKSSSPCQERHPCDSRTPRTPGKPESLNLGPYGWNELLKQTPSTNGFPAKFSLEPVRRNPAASQAQTSVEAVPGVPAPGPEAPPYADKPIQLTKPQPRVRFGSDELPRDAVTRKPQGWALLKVRF